MTEVWQHSKSFEDTNIHMLENEIMVDVTFLAGKSETKVKCHKFILTSRSPVLYAMFCGPLAEKGDVIPIPDIEPEVFRIFLRFLYTGQCKFGADTVLAILYVAKKYDVPTLLQSCSTFLEQNTTTENVCTILDQAISFNEDKLKQTCSTFISEHANEVLKSDAFLSISKETLNCILKFDNLSCKEEDVYVACKKWASRACSNTGKDSSADANIREVLGKNLYFIRFPTMSVDEFTIVAKDDILSAEQKVLIYRDIVAISSDSGFPVAQRQKRTKQLDVLRVGLIKAGWSHNGSQDGISFKVSEPVSLIAVALYRPTEKGAVSGPLEIFEGKEMHVSQNVTLQYDVDEKFEFVSLSKAIPLNPNETYSIRQRLNRGQTFFGDECGNKRTEENVNVEFLELQQGTSANNTDLLRGQFYAIRLEKNI